MKPASEKKKIVINVKETKQANKSDSKGSKQSDLGTGSRLDKYAHKRIRSPRLDIKASQNADMLDFMEVGSKSPGLASNKSMNKNEKKLKNAIFKKPSQND